MENQKIFPWTNLDGEQLFADPLKLRILFTEATHGKFEDLMSEMLAPTEEDGVRLPDFERITFVAMGAMKKLLPATAYAFGLPPYDEKTGQGATQQFLLDLLLGWDDWTQKKSENSDSTVS